MSLNTTTNDGQFIAEQAATIKRLRALLKQLEWQGSSAYDVNMCPCCGDEDEHEKDCALARELEEK